MSDSVWPHRRQPTSLPCPWDSPGKNTGVGCHFLLQCMKVKLLSRVWLLATPRTTAHQAPLSMGFSRQEYWSGLPLPSLNKLYRERQIPYDLAHMWNLKMTKQPQLINTENGLLVARGGDWGWTKMSEGGRKVQTSGYKMNKSWGCNLQLGVYS